MLKIKYSKGLFLIIMLCIHYSYGQTQEKDSLFVRFKNDVKDELYRYNGEVVWDEETKESFYLLMSMHSIESLAGYTNDSIPAIRSRIFAGLTQKNADIKILKEILGNHVNDTAKLTTRSGCIVVNSTVKNDMQSMYDIAAKGTLNKVNFKTRLNKLRKSTNELQIILPGAKHGTITTEDLLKIDRLVCQGGGFRVVSFTLCSNTNSLISDSIFTEPMKDLISNLKSQDFIAFEAIKVIGRDNGVRQVNRILLKIK